MGSTWSRWVAAAVLGAALLGVPSVSHAETAQNFTLRDVDGREVVLSSFSGKVVVISFWATWCGPCKEEMPHLQKMLTELGDRGLVVLSVSTDDARSVSKVKPFVSKMGYTFPVLLDKESTVISAFNPAKTLPYTVIVGRDGQIARRTSGYTPGDELELRTFLEAQLGPATAPAPAP
jgi:peroxiredoxin